MAYGFYAFEYGIGMGERGEKVGVDEIDRQPEKKKKEIEQEARQKGPLLKA
jgi:hypothetical protein